MDVHLQWSSAASQLDIIAHQWMCVLLRQDIRELLEYINSSYKMFLAGPFILWIFFQYICTALSYASKAYTFDYVILIITICFVHFASLDYWQYVLPGIKQHGHFFNSYILNFICDYGNHQRLPI